MVKMLNNKVYASGWIQWTVKTSIYVRHRQKYLQGRSYRYLCRWRRKYFSFNIMTEVLLVIKNIISLTLIILRLLDDWYDMDYLGSPALTVNLSMRSLDYLLVMLIMIFFIDNNAMLLVMNGLNIIICFFSGNFEIFKLWSAFFLP